MLDLTPAGPRSLNLTMAGGSVSVASYLGAPGPQGLPGPGAAAWKAGDTVTVGAVRQAPDGSWIKSTSNRTTGATFDTTEQGFWTTVSTSAGSAEQKALDGVYRVAASAISVNGAVTLPTVTNDTAEHRLDMVGTRVDSPTGVATSTATTGGTLAAGTYSHRVSATNAAGETLASAAVSTVIAAALATPVNAAFTTATTGGSLAAGTYSYRVSATNAIGETLASTATTIVVPAGTATNTVTVNWGAVTGATGYKVYGRVGGSELLIATVGAVTTYTDTGAVTPAGALPAANTTATSTNTVTVTWTASPRATGYKIYGRTAGGELLIATVGAVTTYTDTGSIVPAGALPTSNTTVAAAPVTLPPAVVGKTIVVQVKQDAVGDRPPTLTPAGTDTITWPDGLPSWQTAPSAITVVILKCYTAGTWTGILAAPLTASFTQKPTTDLGDWALLRRDTSDVSKGVAWTTPSALIAKMLGWTVAPEPTGGDDGAALRSLVNAAGTTVLWLRPGTYLANFAAHPVTAGYYCVLALRSGQRLAGPGKGQCTVKLLPNQTVGIDVGGTAMVYNRTLTGGDESIEVVGIEFDGNAANQTKNHNGIVFVRTRGASCSGVRVKNIRGTGSTPPNETFHFDTQLGIDTVFVNCEAVSDTGVQTASGFSANNATGIHYTDCVSRGMKDGMGFTHYQCESVTHAGCRSYLNGNHGFNSEESRDVSYTGCHAGGVVAPGSTPYPYAAATSIGNTGSGFVINGTRNALLAACVGRNNVGAGLVLVEGTNGTSGRITAGYFTGNDRGVSCASTAALARWFFDPATKVEGNTTAQYDLPAALGGYQPGPGNAVAPGPAVPASGVAFANPYPWRCSVYLSGGILTLLRVNGADIDIANKHVTLDPGMTITIFYSAAPTWLWFAL